MSLYQTYPLEEINKRYEEIYQKLTAPFPPGTVTTKEKDPKSFYIPVQPYIHRLNEVVGPHWSWRITNQIIHERENLVQVNGVLRIFDREHEGIGFSHLQRYKDNPQGKISNLKSAIRSAASDALRDATDGFEMGWKDLAPYREWAKNPGVGLEESRKPTVAPLSTETCIVCKGPLSSEDMALIQGLDCEPWIVKGIFRSTSFGIIGNRISMVPSGRPVHILIVWFLSAQKLGENYFAFYPFSHPYIFIDKYICVFVYWISTKWRGIES